MLFDTDTLIETSKTGKTLPLAIYSELHHSDSREATETMPVYHKTTSGAVVKGTSEINQS